jgi:hypothetical protein
MTATDTPDQAEVTPFDPAKEEAFSGHFIQILGGGPPGSGLSFGLIHSCPGPFAGDRSRLSALVTDAGGRW